MAHPRNNGEFFVDYGSRVSRRNRRLGRFTKPRLSESALLLIALLSISLTAFGLRMYFLGRLDSESPIFDSRSSILDSKPSFLDSKDSKSSFLDSKSPIFPKQKEKEEISAYDGGRPPKSKRRRKYFPCEIGFRESVDAILEPENYINHTLFSLDYVNQEEQKSERYSFDPRFGGHQTLEEREKSFYAVNQTLHCGFIKGEGGHSSTGFDLDEKDKAYMYSCKVAVSSCIFGSSDFLRRPTSKLISQYSKDNVCFVLFLDDQTLSKLSSEGNYPDDRGHIGLWKVVVVKNLPYEDMRRTGKVPKFLSHRLFPNSRYSIWLDSKMRLNADPLRIIEYFLWRRKAEYAISNHYDRHCVWEEVLQNKRLNKYDPAAIDEQFNFYQSDGLTKFDPLASNNLLPSYVPEGSFIVRAHTPMSNLFSCLWFNEVDRFTSRDQLSFAYTFLKLRRMNPDRPFYLYMFKDCERRALVKLFRHRVLPSELDTA